MTCDIVIMRTQGIVCVESLPSAVVVLFLSNSFYIVSDFQQGRVEILERYLVTHGVECTGWMGGEWLSGMSGQYGAGRGGDGLVWGEWTNTVE